jgi:hypothetical protein
MLRDRLIGYSQASAEKGGYVEFGYGQVEPNHLSAQRTSQIYAQLPAAASIDVLENGQFVKYDYAKGVVDFDGAGEWMLVYNEIKLYRDFQIDAEFAMKKDNYNARVYSPLDPDTLGWDKQSRFYGGKVIGSDGEMTDEVEFNGVKRKVEKVTAPDDPYEINYNEDPFHIEGRTKAKLMPDGTTMVPRVFKTNVGDIMTLNLVAESELAIGDVLSPRAADGILSKTGDGTINWQVVKVYNLPDRQKAVKVMRIS